MRSKFIVVLLLSVVAGACAAGQLPPIKIVLPERPTAEQQAPAPPAKPRATLAFEVLDDATGAPIAIAFARLEDGQQKQATEAGYIAFELEVGIYGVTFEADEYSPVTRRFQVEANRQFQVRLKSAKPAIAPVPPSPEPLPVAVIAPPSSPPAGPPVTPAPAAIVPGIVSIDQVVAIAKRVHDSEKWDLGAGSSREYRNRFWERVVGIVHFGHDVYNLTADARWHVKDAGGGRAMSDDVIVLMPSREYWDCIPNVGGAVYSFQASAGGPLPLDQNVYAPRRPAAGVVRP